MAQLFLIYQWLRGRIQPRMKHPCYYHYHYHHYYHDPVPELRHPADPEILLDLDGLPALVNNLVHIERGVSLRRKTN